MIRDYFCQTSLVILLLVVVCSTTTNDSQNRAVTTATKLHLKWITNETHFPLEMSIPIGDESHHMSPSQSWDWLRYSDQKLVSKLPDLLLNYVISETANKATLRLLNYNKSTHEQLSSYEPQLITSQDAHAKSQEHILNLSPHEANSTSRPAAAARKDIFTLAYLKSHYIKHEKLAKRIKVTCIADFLVSNSNKTMLDEIMALMEHYASFKLAVKSHVSNNYKNQNAQAPNVVFIGKKQPQQQQQQQQQYALNNPIGAQQPVVQQQVPTSYQPQQLPQPLPQQQPQPQQSTNYYYHPQQQQQQQQQPIAPPQQAYYQSAPQQPLFYQSQSIPVSSYTPVVNMYELFPSGQLYEQFQSEVQHFYNSQVNPVPTAASVYLGPSQQSIYVAPSQQSVYVAPSQPSPSSRRVFLSSNGGFRNYFAPIDSFYREKREIKSSVEDEGEDEATDYDYEKFVKLRLSLGPVSIYKPYDKEETVRCELNLINMDKLMSDYRSQIYETIVTPELDEQSQKAKQQLPKVVNFQQQQQQQQQDTKQKATKDSNRQEKEEEEKEHERRDKSFVHLVDGHDVSKATKPKEHGEHQLSRDRSFVHLIDDDGKRKQEEHLRELQTAYAKLKNSSVSHYCSSSYFALVLIQMFLLVILRNVLF